MKRLVIIALVLLPLACQTSRAPKQKSTTTPGRGVITLTVTPSPVVVSNLGGHTYEFPFDLVIKETGNHPVTIEKVTANVYAGGGIAVANESFDGPKLQALGFAVAIPAKGEIHYHLKPSKDISDDQLLNAAYGDVRVEALDDNGTRASATTSITVKRK